MSDELQTENGLVEEWRQIPSLPAYLVSTYGRVRGPKKILKLKIGSWTKNGVTYPGYWEFAYRKHPGKNGMRNVRVHKAMAEAFLPPDSSRPHVNHIDGNKLNNHISNLERCTISEDSFHKYRVLGWTGQRGEESPVAIRTAQEILEIRRLYAEGVPQKVIADRFGIPLGSMYGIVKRVNWKYV